MNQKGFVNIFVIIAIIAVAGASGYFVISKKEKRNQPIVPIAKNGQNADVNNLNTLSPQTTITIDASKKAGEMPYLFRGGIWLQDRDNYEYILPKFFKDNVVGKIQLEIGNELSNTKNFSEFKQAMDKKYALDTIFREAIEEIKKSGQTLIIGHWPGKMPEWLSSRAGDDRSYSDTGFKIRPSSPPKCYDYKCVKMEEVICYTEECANITKKQLSDDGYVTGWAGIVDYTLRYFKDTLGVDNLGYYFGHEQNKDWMGAEEELYKTYKFTLKAAKAIDKKILVGGAGPWGWDASRLDCNSVNYNEIGISLCKNIPGWSTNDEPMNKNFIKYAKDNNLQMDFINWHSFGVSPLSFQNQAEEMRSWLKNNGFNENISLYPADWTVWSFTYPADYIDTEYSSSYIINSIYNMDKAGIQWHGHDFNVFGHEGEVKVIKQRGPDAQFIGDWPIFTRGQIIKPSYNAFKALSILYGKKDDETSNKIEINLEDDYIAALASQTKDKTKTRILLSSFAPDGNMLIQYLISKFQESPSMQSTKPQREEINSCVQDNEDVSAPGKSQERITQCLNNVLAKITDQAIKERVRAQVELVYCFKSSKDKIQCVQDVYDKTPDQQTKEDINSVKSEYQEITKYQKTPRQLSLEINNLPFSGKAKLIIYTIDKSHSNSCAYNKKTEEAPTNTACGIEGAIDKAVARAKQEAREKALTEASDYLKEKGYANEQMASFKNQAIVPCLGQEKALSCIQKAIDSACQKYPNINCDKLKQDLSDTYSKYQEVYSALLYYGKYNNLTISTWIDKINNDQNISLESSKQTKEINIKGGAYQETMVLEPYSVKLVEIMK